MDSQIAAELLYESEATLRMVDTALDELQIADLEPRFSGPRLKAVYSGHDPEPAQLEIPSEFCVRAYWQIHELLDSVRQSREAVQALGSGNGSPTDEPNHGGEAGAVDHALALIDRLDTLDGASYPERRTLHEDLRRDLLGIVERADQISHSSDRLSAITILLAETEARLTKLGHLFDSGGGGGG